MKELIKKAAELLKYNYSEQFIEAKLWQNRNYSLKQVNEAIKTAKNNSITNL